MSFLQRYFFKIKRENANLAAVSFLAALDHLSQVSPEVAEAIVNELKAQRAYLKLIASENYSSLAVQLAMGNLLTDKYSEGYVGHRFYIGCENVDKVEGLAVSLAKKIFDCDHAYVQPHSGADANLVAFWSILVKKIQNREVERLGKKKIDELLPHEYEEIRKMMCSQKIMGLSLTSGGHLTHGYIHNISSKMMQSISYSVDPKTHLIDYAKLDALVKKERPLILVGGYSAYPRLLNFAKMKEIADSVGAVLMVDMAHFAGLVAGKVMMGEFNPVPYADIVTSTTHKTLRGPRGGMILCKQEYREMVDKGCPLVLGGPMPHVMAAKAVCFKEADSSDFCQYAENVVNNARVLAESFSSLGIEVLTGGTDNHMLLIDVYKNFGLTGRQAEIVLRKGGLNVNRNMIPEDLNGPWYTSGIRIGTPAVTTLQMKTEEMKEIAKIIYMLLKKTKPGSQEEVDIDEAALQEGKVRVKQLLSKFPLYPELVIE